MSFSKTVGAFAQVSTEEKTSGGSSLRSFAPNDIFAMIAATGVKSSIFESITQASHGFTTGDALRFGNSWVKAIASGAATSEALGIVQSVANSNEFSIVYGGRISTLTGLSTGVQYYLSPFTSGALTSVEPTGSYISKPLLWSTSSTGGIVNSQRALTPYYLPETLMMAVSDETTALTAGTSKFTFRMPYQMHLTGIKSSLNIAATGANFIIDVNQTGVSFLSTKLSITTGQLTSLTAASQPVISGSVLYNDNPITVDFDQVGSTYGGAGAKLTLLGYKVI